MKTKKHDTRWLVSVALMAAIIIVLANTPLGMIQLPVIKATTVHIPVILGAILLGPSAGAILGGVFGICSVVSNTMTPTLLSFAFSPFMSTTGIPGAFKALWVAVGCRILLGVAAGWLWILFRKVKVNEVIALPIVGFVLLGAAGYVAPQSKVLVIVCCALLFFGSGLSLGVTTCCMADVIDYGEVKFGVRNESVTCSAQTFLMKAAMAAAGGLTGIGLQIVGYNAKAVTQSTATVMGIRVLMIVIPIILAFASFGIYKKYYILKGEKMEEITRKVNEMHAKKQTA